MKYKAIADHSHIIDAAKVGTPEASELISENKPTLMGVDYNGCIAAKDGLYTCISIAALNNNFTPVEG